MGYFANVEHRLADVSWGWKGLLRRYQDGLRPVHRSSGPAASGWLERPIRTNTEHIWCEHHFGKLRVLANFVSEPPATVEPNGLSVPVLHLGKDDLLRFGQIVHDHSGGAKAGNYVSRRTDACVSHFTSNLPH